MFLAFIWRELQLREVNILTELKFIWPFCNCLVCGYSKIFLMNAFSKQFIHRSLCAYKAELKDSSPYVSFDLRTFCPHHAFHDLASEVAQSDPAECCRSMPSPAATIDVISEKEALCSSNNQQESAEEEESSANLPDIERDDMLVRRMGTFQRRTTSTVPIHCPPLSVAQEKDLKTPRGAERSENGSRSL